MRAEKRILTNTAVLGVGEAVGQVASFVFVVVVGRAYGAGVLGWYSLGMAAGAMATVLVTLGTHSLLLRELAQRPEESARRIGGTLPYQLAASLLILAVLIGALAAFVEDSTGRWVVATLIVYHLLVTATALLLIPFRARQIMWPSAVTGAALRAVAVIAAVALIGLGFSAGPVFTVFPVTAVVTAIVVFVAANRFLGTRIAQRINAPAAQRALYAESMPFFGSAVLDTLYARLGLLMLTIIVSAESAGIFTAAERLLLIVSVLRLLFMGALYPAVAHFAAVDRDRALELSNRSMRLILVLTVPAAGLLAIFHREIIALMFGAAFAESALVLVLLTPLLIIRGINGLWLTQAIAIGLQASVFRARALMVAVFVASGSILVTLAGPTGLAWALLIAESVQIAALHALLVKEGFLARAFPVLVRPLLAVAAGTAAYVGLAAVALPLRAAGVIAVLGAAMFATGAVRMHDLMFLRSILKQSSPS